MIIQNRKALMLATALAAQAGFVDALGFIHLGGYFVSFMSGNSTRFAVGAVEALHTAILPLALITLFVTGVMAGTVIEHFAGRRKAVTILSFVFALLTLAAILNMLGYDWLAIACMALAMGAENDVFVKKGEVSVAVTYMTGTLVKLGQRIAANFFEPEKKPWFPYLALWLGLVSGAIVGSLCYVSFKLDALWIAAGFSLLMAVSTHIVNKNGKAHA